MFSNIPHIIGFGIVEILLSQLPNFHKLSWLSKLAALMSFVYTSIGIGLSIAKIVSGKFSSIYVKNKMRPEYVKPSSSK